MNPTRGYNSLWCHSTLATTLALSPSCAPTLCRITITSSVYAKDRCAMTTAKEQRPGPPARSVFARRRAEAEGLLAEKGDPTTVRIPGRLLAAARSRLGLERTTDVVTTALAQVVYEDEFGEYLLTLKGRASEGYMAELEREWAGDDARG